MTDFRRWGSAAALVVLLGAWPVHAQPASDAKSAAETERPSAEARLPRSLDVLRDKSLANLDHNGLAQHCLALAAAERREGKGRYLEALQKVSQALISEADLNKDGRFGWGVPAEREKHKACPETGMLDAFADGSCNPALTEYTFQTGLAVMCLSQASLLQPSDSVKTAIRKAMDDSWTVGTQPRGCPGCYYYWYSYHRNDADRYVRNTNVLMGAAAAWAWKATGESRYRERAQAIANTEQREIDANNWGYFGIDDPKYKANASRERERIENHVPWVAKGLYDIGRLLGLPATVKAAVSVQDSWQSCRAWSCKDDCGTWAADARRCNQSVTMSPCFLRDAAPAMADACRAASRIGGSALNAYQVWSQLDP